VLTASGWLDVCFGGEVNLLMDQLLLVLALLLQLGQLLLEFRLDSSR
jgi:hypothetical protein